MSYNITLTNGQSLTTVADGTTDTASTSITLVGKNFAGYGQFLNEDLVALLENFSNATSPPNPLQGQIWWNSTSKTLQVWTSTQWKGVSSTTTAATAPTNPNSGDLWWDTANGQLKVYNSATTSWVVIGPSYTSGQGQTGAIAAAIYDTLAIKHIVIQFYVNNNIMAIMSGSGADSLPYTVTGLSGFTVINPGLTLSTVNGLQFYGNANNAINLGSQPYTSYLRSDISGTLRGDLTIFSDTGSNLSIVSSNSSSVEVSGTITGKDITFYANVAGVKTKELTLDGTLGVATVPNITSTSPGSSISNKFYADSAMDAGTIVSTRSATITGPVTSVSAANIASVAASTYRSAEFLIQATDSTSSKYQISKIIAVQDGTTAYATEYGSVSSGTIIATYSATLFGGPTGSLVIQATPASTNSTTFKVTTISVTS